MTGVASPTPHRETLTSPTRGRRALLRELGLAGVIVAAAVVPILASPRLPRELEARRCVRVADLPGGLHITINCDSPAFMYLARDPRLLFSPEQRVRQTRPLYPVIGWVVAAPFRALGFAELGRRLPGGSGTTSKGAVYGTYLPEYIAFQLINWALLTGAVVLLRRLVAAPSYFAPRMLLPLAVLLVNEVTKAFFWTPHLQILNIFISVASLSLLMWLEARGLDLDWRHTLGVGLALGLGSLAYGGFAVPAAAATLCLLFSGRSSARHLVSATSRAAGLLVGFALPIGAWSAVLVSRTGALYSHEVETYRQFVWVRDASARGTDALWSDALAKFGAYGRSLFMVTGFIVLTLVGIRLLSYAARVARAPSPHEVASARAIIWFVIADAAFYAFLGDAPTRLAWTIVPALLVLVGHEVGQLEAGLGGKGRTALTVSVALLAVTYMMYWFVRAGPYG